MYLTSVSLHETHEFVVIEKEIVSLLGSGGSARCITSSARYPYLGKTHNLALDCEHGGGWWL